MENVVALVGVALGFGLGAGWEFIRETRKKKRAKALIQKELEANRTMIPQRVDLLTKMQKDCEEARILFWKGSGLYDEILRSRNSASLRTVLES